MSLEYFNLKRDYDKLSDSLALHIVNNFNYKVSCEVDNNLIFDISENGYVTGFEVLYASEYLNINPDLFYKIIIKLDITKDIVYYSIRILEDDKILKINNILKGRILNDYNLKTGEYHYRLKID